MHFKRRTKKIKKNIYVPTLPGTFKHVTRNTLVFLFGVNNELEL